MMHLLRKYDVAPLRFAMMRCLPLCARRHTSLGVAVIIGQAHIICQRQTSFKKRTFVSRQKCVFCCLKRDKRCLNRVKNEQKVSNNGNKNYFFLFFICLTMTTPNKITDIKRRGAAQTWSANGILINRFNKFIILPINKQMEAMSCRIFTFFILCFPLRC